MFCQKCGTEITYESQRFCHKCGARLSNAEEDVERGKDSSWNREKKEKNIASKISEFTGGEGQINLHLWDMVSGVFKHHTTEETEELFICGTSKTTPKERDIITEWPKPWFYSRVFVLLVAVYFALTFMWKSLGNEYSLMNIPYMGTLIGPITILVFFFEINVPRNISVIKTFKVFLAGGVSSLLFTLMLFGIAPSSDLTKVSGAIVVGVVEEIGKIGICAFFISKHKGKTYLLNGILYGGAVGAGFAVFESVGYALCFGIESGISGAIQAGDLNYFYIFFYERMLQIVKMRGFLSPGGHIAWAAVEGFAIVLAMNGAKFTWEVLVKSDFLKIVWIPVALHAFWDAPLLNQLGLMYNCKMIFLVASIWVVLLVFISRGLHQVSKVKAEAKKKEQEE